MRFKICQLKRNITVCVRKSLLPLVIKKNNHFVAKQPWYNCIIEKVFNSVNRDCIWQALRSRGIPEKIAIIKATYDGAKCRVLNKGKLSEPFEVHSGVRLDCILWPILFLIVLGDVVKAALLSHRNKGLRWMMNCFLEHLHYADDICLLSHKMSPSRYDLFPGKKRRHPQV